VVVADARLKPPDITFLKSTQVFNEAYAPTTIFASLPYLFSDFVDFSTVKENSFASYAFFNLDAFNLGDDHNVRAFRALYLSLIWQCHSGLPWTANLICQQLKSTLNVASSFAVPQKIMTQ
jgi:hypothetical protein